MASSPKKVAVIVGAGSKHDRDGSAEELPPTERFGLGGALALTFATEFHVALMGRRLGVLEAVAAEVTKAGGDATPVVCDVTSDASVAAAFGEAKALGDVEVLVFNASAPFPPGVDFTNLPAIEDIDPTTLTRGFDIGVTGCLRCAKQVLPDMTARGHGSILLSGATMALRGGKGFGCLSPLKFGLRSLGQTMFQEYAPKGVHVAHVIVDGVIASPNTRAWQDKAPGLQLQDPKHLAEAFLALHHQPPTVWTQELQLSPNTASIGMRL